MIVQHTQDLIFSPTRPPGLILDWGSLVGTLAPRSWLIILVSCPVELPYSHNKQMPLQWFKVLGYFCNGMPFFEIIKLLPWEELCDTHSRQFWSWIEVAHTHTLIMNNLRVTVFFKSHGLIITYYRTFLIISVFDKAISIA